MIYILNGFKEIQLRKLNEIAKVLTQPRNAIIREAVNNYIYNFYYKGRIKGRVERKFFENNLQIEQCHKLMKGECHVFAGRLD